MTTLISMLVSFKDAGTREEVTIFFVMTHEPACR
jgi:hypothetical protein